VSLRLVVDYSLCQSNGICTAYADQELELDAESRLVLMDAEPDESRRGVLLDAVDACPTGALSLEG
jgi:ferredoxin